MAYKNSEGYPDPTAGKAIKEADKPPEAVRWIIKTYKDIASLMGYDLVGDVILKDKKTKREWKG